MTLPVGELLPFTRYTIADLEPSSLERVAAYLDAIRVREPLRSGESWANERIVLGCLVTDLRDMVRDAGEPTGVHRDLRDARTRADELSARARAEMAERAYHDDVTAAIEEDRAARFARLGPMPEPEPDPVTPAPVATPDELYPWM